MITIAAFPSTCKVCKKWIGMGDRVVREGTGYQHERCANPAAAVVPKSKVYSGKPNCHHDSLQKALKTTPSASFPGYTRKPTLTLSNRPIVSRPGMEYFPFQAEGIRWLLSRHNSLLADEMGLGKSIEAIGFINSSPEIKNILLVCPSSLRYNWRHELKTWLVDSPYRITALFPEAPIENIHIAICPFSQLSKVPTSAKFDLLLIDEAHYIKSKDAQRTRHIERIARQSARLLFLTGSPIENRAHELWMLLKLLDPSEWNAPTTFNGQVIPEGEDAGYNRYVIRYCGAKTAFHWQTLKDGTKKKKRYFDLTGSTNLKELNQRLRDSCMVRRLKSEVLKDLPAKTRQIVILPPLNPDVEAMLMVEHEAFKESGLDYETDILSLSKAQILFPEIAKARHDIGMMKVPLVVEHVINMLESGVQKVVVFAHHKDVIYAINDGLVQYQPVTYLGETTEKLRDRAVTLFQTNYDTRVFVGGLTAAGVGLTLTAAQHVVFAEIDWKDMRQAEDRVHRIGQRSNVLIQILVFDWSVDANMARKILEKMKIAEVAIDGKF